MAERKETLIQLVARIIADKVLEEWLAEDSPARGNPAPPTRGAKARNPREVVKCPKCPKRFVNLRGVEVHISRMHKETP